MSNILGIAVSGLNAAAARVANSTNNIVNASSTNFTPQDIVSVSNAIGGVNTQSQPRPASTDPSGGNGVDIAAELVSNIAAQTSYGANAAVVKITNKLQKTLLDTIA